MYLFTSYIQKYLFNSLNWKYDFKYNILSEAFSFETIHSTQRQNEKEKYFNFQQAAAEKGLDYEVSINLSKTKRTRIGTDENETSTLKLIETNYEDTSRSLSLIFISR